MERSFPCRYAAQSLDVAPDAPLARYSYPDMPAGGGRGGLLVEVRPEQGAPWLGAFAAGQLSPQGVSGVFATPDPQRLCVVARGEGYLVSAAAPTVWEPVRSRPILDVRPVPSRGLLIFADDTELVAYGPAGLAWMTKRLAWEGLKINEVGDRFLRGEFWDFRRDTIVPFTVDLKTGAHRGGVEGR